MALFAGLALALGVVRQAVQARPAPDVHEHVDFALFLDGQRFNFSRDEFMSNVPCSIAFGPRFGINVVSAHGLDVSAIHLHDNDGETIHLHRAGLVMHDFFDSLEMPFGDGFFVDHEGKRYEDNETSLFRYFVNNEEVSTLADREIGNLDRILISYGSKDRPEALVDAELKEIGSRACVFSGSCTHRGVAPIESCGSVDAKPGALLRWLGV